MEATTPTITHNGTLGQQHEGLPNSLLAARAYLGRLEAVARYGRLSADPAEVVAALRCFTSPSRVLWRLSERNRRCA
jgi:hypothetical protein